MIGHQLSIRAALEPHAVALVFGDRRYSYVVLNERACRMAQALSSLGLRRSDRVAVLLHNCNAFVEILFACAKLGLVFVPVNFRLVAAEVGQLLAACSPAVLMVSPDLADMLTPIRTQEAFPSREIVVDDRVPDAVPGAEACHEKWLRSHPAIEPEISVDATEPLMLLHSSGTTGLPKGAIYTHGTVFASCTAKIIDFNLTHSDITVVFGPLFHAGPLMDLALPLLLRGGTLVIGASRQFDAERLLDTLARERATVAPVYPVMLRRLLAVEKPNSYDLSHLRMFITGGESVPVPVLHGIYERYPTVDLINNYGSTEGGPVTTWLPASEKMRKAGSVGRPSFGVEVRIAGEQGEPLGPGCVGEVLVRSAFVCRGYWNRSDLTAESLRNGWWHTGDLAWRDDEGCIWISGRKKDMIKSGAEAIYPVEVEQAIAMLPQVAETAVIGVPDAEWGESVLAFVVRSPGAQLEEGAVIEHCRSHLASYKKPRFVRFIESLPRNGANKVNKTALRALAAQQA